MALILWVVFRPLFVWSRRTYHRRGLPEASIAPALLETCQKQVFREICRRSPGPGRGVGMTDYFIERGWNRADALLALAEPLKHRLIGIQGWQFGTYYPTRRGWEEYRKHFMWTRSDEPVHISATPGGFVIANVDSPHGVIQIGDNNNAHVRDIPNRQLINALREDARIAEGDEAARATEYAEDLEEAVQTEDSNRADKVIARINALLATAQAAFSLTRDLLPPRL